MVRVHPIRDDPQHVGHAFMQHPWRSRGQSLIVGSPGVVKERTTASAATLQQSSSMCVQPVEKRPHYGSGAEK